MDSICYKDDETFHCLDHCLKAMTNFLTEERLKSESLINVLLKISEKVILPTQRLKCVPIKFQEICSKSKLFNAKLLSMFVLNGYSKANLDIRYRKRNLNYLFSWISHAPIKLEETKIQTIIKFTLKGLHTFR